jgi:hypothetical protein
MTRNLFVCGLGLLLAGGLGLSATRASIPPGTLAVGDHQAAQVYGGQQLVPCCVQFEIDANLYGCGLQAKPGAMGTNCPRKPFYNQNPNGAYSGLNNPFPMVPCVECCYLCGQRQYFITCAQGMGSGPP